VILSDYVKKLRRPDKRWTAGKFYFLSKKSFTDKQRAQPQ
jgi:hypothetical protein